MQIIASYCSSNRLTERGCNSRISTKFVKALPKTANVPDLFLAFCTLKQPQEHYLIFKDLFFYVLYLKGSNP